MDESISEPSDLLYGSYLLLYLTHSPGCGPARHIFDVSMSAAVCLGSRRFCSSEGDDTKHPALPLVKHFLSPTPSRVTVVQQGVSWP